MGNSVQNFPSPFCAHAHNV